MSFTEIVYNIGAPDLTAGLYSFSQVALCNYPETVNLTNLPTFVTHNEVAKDFTIKKNSDLSLLGEYPVTIKSEICVTDDYTKNSCTKKSASFEFKIIFESCSVDSYTATKQVGDLVYNVGAPSLQNVG